MKFLFRKLFDKLASIEAGLLSILLIVLFGLFSLLFLSVWAAYLIGTELEDRAAGFGIVAAIYFVFFIFTILFRKKSIKPFFEEMAKDNKEK